MKIFFRKVIAIGERIAALDKANTAEQVLKMDHINFQETLNEEILPLDFTNNIYQICFQNYLFSVRINVLSLIFLNNHSKVMDDIYAIYDKERALELQVAFKRHGISDIKTTYAFQISCILLRLDQLEALMRLL
jgi:hypothetical protein